MTRRCWSHRTEHRADALERLLIRVLEQYRDDVEVHKCDSCLVNVEIFEREAAALGIALSQETAA